MKKSTKRGLEGAAALAGAAGAAAGAYYFYGSKNAKKNRKAAGVWMGKAEREVMANAKKLKIAATDKKNYDKVVKAVSAKYKDLQKLDAKDVAEFVRGMSEQWRTMNAKIQVKKAMERPKKKPAAKATAKTKTVKQKTAPKKKR
jgi:uncharacterized protein HemX